MPSTRKRLHLSALLVSLALIVACGGGGSGGDTDTTCDGTDCIDSNVPMTSATMTIDGEIDDWENIPPIVIDGAGDNYPRSNFSGTDLEAFYLAIDRTYLYGLFTLHDGHPREDGTIYFFVANQEEGVHYADGDFSVTAGYMDSEWRL